jgi:hypothetical protein
VNAVRPSDSALFFIVLVLFETHRVSNDDSRSVALIRYRFPPAFQALIKRSVLRTYNFGLIRMIAFRLCVSCSRSFLTGLCSVLEHILLSYLIEFRTINRPEVCALFAQHLAQICSSAEVSRSLWPSFGLQYACFVLMGRVPVRNPRYGENGERSVPRRRRNGLVPSRSVLAA